MSNLQENYDDDVEWLYRRMEAIGKRPTEDQEHAFAERVAIMVCDGEITVKEARTYALSYVLGIER